MKYDKNAICVYRTPSESERKMLVGHVPIELSRLLNNFLKANESNKLVVKVSGKRKRKVALVCSSEIQNTDEGVYRLAKILEEHLQDHKENVYTHFQIGARAQNNGRSPDNDRPKMPLDWSLFYLTGHFDRPHLYTFR